MTATQFALFSRQETAPSYTRSYGPPAGYSTGGGSRAAAATGGQPVELEVIPPQNYSLPSITPPPPTKSRLSVFSDDEHERNLTEKFHYR